MEKFAEKRHSRRFAVTLNAKVISDGKSYEGIIGNVSEEGLAYTITTFIQVERDFTPQKTIDIVFRLPSGEKLNLNCEVRWYLKPSPNNNTIILGMKILAPPPEYKKWIKKFELRQP